MSKRTNFDDDGGNYSGKVQKYETKMRFLLIGKYCGSFIGKGGENVKMYREKFDVQVHLPDPDCIHRVLTLTGEKENIIKVVEEYMERTKETPPYFSGKRRYIYEINYLANTEEVGAVIGARGDKVREILDKTGGKVKVYPDCLPNSTERVIALGALEKNNFVAAFNMVLDLLAISPAKYSTRYYEPSKDANLKYWTGEGMDEGNQMGDGRQMGSRDIYSNQRVSNNQYSYVDQMGGRNQFRGYNERVGGNQIGRGNQMDASGEMGGRQPGIDLYNKQDLDEIAASANEFLKKIGFYDRGGDGSHNNRNDVNRNMSKQGNMNQNIANNGMNSNYDYDQRPNDNLNSNYADNRGPNDDRNSNYSNNQDPYDSRNSNYSNNQDPYDSRNSNYSNNQDPYDSRNSNYSNNQDPYDSRTSNYSNNQDPYDSRNSNYSNNQDPYDNRISTTIDSGRGRYDKYEDMPESSRNPNQNFNGPQHPRENIEDNSNALLDPPQRPKVNADQSGFSKFKTEVKITVPHDVCGPIIGVKASVLHSIRDVTGVSIELNKTPKGSKEDRVFTLVGTHKQVTVAQRIMADAYQNN